ncbi:MAG: GAP family protein, partial [Solirubrobacteraceae bacterium]|nr:GAP family protein [Solirubrobacteraceae bacterium]
MEPALIATLLVLALVDATSVGTLGIPVWLGLQPRVRARAIGVYLVAVAGFYLVVGVVLYAGALAAFEAVVDATEGDARLVAQLLVGVGLFALSFKVDPIGGRKKATARGDDGSRGVPEDDRDGGHELASAPSPGQGNSDGEAVQAGRPPTRLDRLKARVSGESFDGRAAVTLAVGAASIELLMMLPYLAAIGMLADAGPGIAPAIGRRCRPLRLVGHVQRRKR